MPNKKTICVVTSTRADYGLLFWLMKRIKESKVLRLELAVTGSHLSKSHGETYKFIEADDFTINKKIEILNGSDLKDIGEAAGKAVSKFTAYFTKVKPSALVILGDRFEILAVAQAAAISTIPLIHLHGGELTEGANDDLFRHAITKLSSFHFTSNAQHRNRVIQMGEQPRRVKTVGAFGIENIKKLKLLSKAELEKKFSLKFNKHIFLITFHPATMEKASPEQQFKNLLKALSHYKETTFIISKANADAGGDKINALIDEFAKHNQNCLASTSFGQLNYLSLMKASDVIIGNSSSGIIEAPSLKTITVNLGSRQKGRMRAKSVINCETNEHSIVIGINKALKQKGRARFKNPYDHGSSSEKVVSILEKTDFTTLLPKTFYDLKKWTTI